MDMHEPLDPTRARRLIGDILRRGHTVSFSHHACKEMAKDDLSTVDCINVLRAGVVEPGELEKGTWRYRVRTNRIMVVVAFGSETHLRVVTAWRVAQ